MAGGITRDTAKDVMRISGTTALIAARLCNFKTGEAFLQLTHQSFLDDEVRPIVRASKNCWIDLYGYASRAGDANFNLNLSKARITSVRNRIDLYRDNINFAIFSSLGETESGPIERNDDGYYRAVEVYVYGQKPNPSPIPPKPQEKIRRFVRRSFSKFDAKSDMYKGPSSTEDMNELLRFLIAAGSGKLSAEGLLGQETKAEGRTMEINSDFRVNKVIIDQKVMYDSFVGGSVTSMDTIITYEWGLPTMSVVVEHRYQATILKEQRAPQQSVQSVPRSQTHGNPVLIPPDP
ncbi:MAG: hypothetical protein ACK50Q_03710 [Labrys sp. (in: a-proteobacteria)]